MMYVVLNAQHIEITINLSELPGVTEIKYFVKYIACLLWIFLLDFVQNIEFVLVSQLSWKYWNLWKYGKNMKF